METATDICSVALSRGDQLLALQESGPQRSHATLLNQYIKQVLQNADLDMNQLDAVSVSKGPGSYTGLRIGVSTSKGIAYALGIPVIASGTLENMASGASSNPAIQELATTKKEYLLAPMLDARRMEVYAAFFKADGSTFRDVSADIVDQDSYREILDHHPVIFFGSGADKCTEVLTHPNAHLIKGFHPSAAHMIQPALKRFGNKQFEDVAYFEPYYLKEFIATTPKKKVL